MAEDKVNYVGYQNMVAQVNTGLVEMENICAALGMEHLKHELVVSRRRLAEHKFSVGILGEFKRGKSTVINSLLEKEIMPADILPCSATMNRVTYDLRDHAEVLMTDGTVKDIPVNELKGYVTKTSKENEAVAARVQEAIVYYPCRFCQNGVDIIDTPGLNDDERMNRITENVIPRLDAIIMVITQDAPFSMSEAEFVRNKIMTSDIGRLIFIVNKMDAVRRAADKERIVADIRERIKDSVMGKISELYSEDSREYKAAKTKIANIRVYPFSAIDALDGKTAGDDELIKRSGTIEFENVLTKMLTEERGALELGTPLNLLIRAAIEAEKTAAARKEALQLSADEFRTRKDEALAEIESIRKKKLEEKTRLEASALASKNTLLVQMSDFYSDLEERLARKVDEVSIDTTTLKTDAGKKAAVEKINAEVKSEMDRALSNMAERTEAQLKTIVDIEAVNIADFIEDSSLDLYEKLSSFSRGAAKHGASTVDTLVGTGLDIATDFLGVYGIGGLYAGYKQAGIKGALLGGGTSFVTSVAAGILLTSMSVAFLPMTIISCAIGTVLGKGLVKTVFSSGEKTLQTLRTDLKAAVSKMVLEFKKEGEMEEWIRQRVETCFDKLTTAMEDECERILCDTEKTIESIKEELVKNKVERSTLEQRYDHIIASVRKIMDDIDPTAQKVLSILSHSEEVYQHE